MAAPRSSPLSVTVKPARVTTLSYLLTGDRGAEMLFGKLLPRDGNFFVMFNQHATHIVVAARAFPNMVANYGDPAWSIPM